MVAMRRAILIFSLLGAGVFSAALLLSWAQPLLVERAARELLRLEVQQQVEGRLDALSDSRIAVFAQRALRRSDAELEQARRAMREGLPDQVATVVARMLDPDCACRQRIASLAREVQGAHLASLLQARERLTSLIESAYASVSRSLLREFRIFTASNAVAFGLLALVAFLRKQASVQLLLPAIAIAGAVAVTGGLYLFNQDWLRTIVFGDYVGWGYAAWLSAVALLLADILLNRARVCTALVNLVLAVPVAPC